MFARPCDVKSKHRSAALANTTNGGSVWIAPREMDGPGAGIAAGDGASAGADADAGAGVAAAGGAGGLSIQTGR